MVGAIVWRFCGKANAAGSPLFLKWGHYPALLSLSVSPLFQILETILPSLNLGQSPTWIQYAMRIQPLLPSLLSSHSSRTLLLPKYLVYFRAVHLFWFVWSVVCSELHWTDGIQKSVMHRTPPDPPQGALSRRGGETVVLIIIVDPQWSLLNNLWRYFPLIS